MKLLLRTVPPKKGVVDEDVALVEGTWQYFHHAKYRCYAVDDKILLHEK